MNFHSFCEVLEPFIVNVSDEMIRRRLLTLAASAFSSRLNFGPAASGKTVTFSQIRFGKFYLLCCGAGPEIFWLESETTFLLCIVYSRVTEPSYFGAAPAPGILYPELAPAPDRREHNFEIFYN